ncbi:biotin synthase BioB [Anaeromusa acidaminophila]|uniref:biotin synthase BioB n=1 Tax=Anaeromusa acidaminophila TaxID=81464 RepID=UPI00035FC8CE|nr:biotin synthase BioB [Anaeromusa acidaminophila]
MKTNASEIIRLGEQVLTGRQLSGEEALALTRIDVTDIPLLAAYAHKVRQAFGGNHVDMCGVLSARTGQCSEDCKFCSQSIHYSTQVAPHALLPIAQLVEEAKAAEQAGAKRISLVTSGKGMEGDADFEAIILRIQAIAAETKLQVCANLGTLNRQQAMRLRDAGVRRYAHNLETSVRFYPDICTTHPYQERAATLAAAKEAGLELCSGGIIGLGEDWQDRIDLALALREFAVQSVPINILNPIPGTPLSEQKPLPVLEILHTIALFRLLLPEPIVRPAGGREINLRDMQGAAMLAGANGLIVGHYLTFSGRNTAADFQMAADAQLKP